MDLIISLIIFAYLLGSISSAIIVCKLGNLPDPRATGSNNPGATNVLRIAGKKAAFLTLLGDVLKGFIPVLLARLLLLDETIQVIILLSAVVGHWFPVFFKFQGGKGVATMLGGLFAFSWQLAVLWSLTWLIIAICFRYSSLSALIATFLLPIYSWVLLHNENVTLILSILSLMIIYKHKLNIQRLWTKTEKKIGQKS